MRVPSVILLNEITHEDAFSIIRWLKKDEVLQYLNEVPNVAKSLEHALVNMQIPILNFMFNQNGKFLMVYTSERDRIGFVKFIPKLQHTEIVIVIGETNQWGKGYGTKAILESLNFAFCNLRTPIVIAKIHPENRRSIRAFSKAGFKKINDLKMTKVYRFTQQDYLENTLRRRNG